MNKQLEEARQKVYQLQELQRIAMMTERWDMVAQIQTTLGVLCDAIHMDPLAQPKQ